MDTDHLCRWSDITGSELDIPNCLSLTDACCASIARNCKVLEVLGLTNLKDLRGTDLCKFFHDDRDKQFRAIMLSGSKNVRHLLDMSRDQVLYTGRKYSH